jgi:hypothetical protein
MTDNAQRAEPVRNALMNGTESCRWTVSDQRHGDLVPSSNHAGLLGIASADGYSAEQRIRIGSWGRYYRLTPDGAARLATEAARLRANAATAIARLGPAEGLAR